MTARPRRLSRAGFSTLSHARRLSTPHFTLSIAPAGALGGCAAVIPKKVAPKSVDRHLLKRRILSLLTPWCRSELALAVFAKAGAGALPFRAIRSELEPALATLTNA